MLSYSLNVFADIFKFQIIYYFRQLKQNLSEKLNKLQYENIKLERLRFLGHYKKLTKTNWLNAKKVYNILITTYATVYGKTVPRIMVGILGSSDLLL